MPATANAGSHHTKSGSDRRVNFWGTIVPLGLLMLYAAQCAWFIRTQSLTYDEPVHIAEGLDAWRNGRFQDFIDHPPLARLWCTLPICTSEWQLDLELLPDGFRLHRAVPDAISLANRARGMNVVLGLLLGVLLWCEAARAFSVAAANFALALFAFAPSLIAHFSLVTTDGAATLMIFATATRVVEWARGSTWKCSLQAGIVLGVTLLSKFSTLPMFALALFWLLLLGNGTVCLRPRQWHWTKVWATFLTAMVVLWAGYFFHVSRLTIRDRVLTVTHPHWNSALVKPARSNINLSIPVPAGEYVAGFRDLLFHNARGQRAFFLGQVSPTGGWRCYPVAILLKWPLALLMASIVGLLLVCRRQVSAPRGLWVVLSFPALYFVLAIFAHFNIGERHVLPLYPFALLLAAAAGEHLRRQRWGMALTVGILLFHAADVLRYAPAYLSYFDVVIRPEQSYRLLSDSNLDWGQGLLAVRQYEREHPDQPIWLAYFGSVDPQVYGIRTRPLPESQRVTGTVMVGATQFSGQYLQNPGGYRWLLGDKPQTILDHCIYVFVVAH
jgi:hypothetical protein